MKSCTELQLPTVKEAKNQLRRIHRLVYGQPNELIHGEPNAIRKQAKTIQERVRTREGEG